jgi:hypothetical protein
MVHHVVQYEILLSNFLVFLDLRFDVLVRDTFVLLQVAESVIDKLPCRGQHVRVMHPPQPDECGEKSMRGDFLPSSNDFGKVGSISTRLSVRGSASVQVFLDQVPE